MVQRLRARIWIGCLVWVALAGVGEALGGGGPRLAPGRFVAGFMEAPAIDGTIGTGEWDRAVVTSGIMAAFSQTLQTAPTEMGVGTDGEEFFFYFVCHRAAREWTLGKSVRTNDDYSFGDPSVEIWVSPPAEVAQAYQSLINTYPAVLDKHIIPSRGYTAKGWRGRWRLGVTETDDLYVIEAAVPVADFGHEAVAPGETWNFLLARTAKGAKPRDQGSWSATGGFGEIPQYPDVRFSTSLPVVQLRQVSSILSGTYELPVTVTAAPEAGAEVTVSLRWHKEIAASGEDTVLTKTATLQPAEGRTLTFAGTVPEKNLGRDPKRQDRPPKGYLTVTAATAEGEEIFRQQFAFQKLGWTWQAPTRPADREPPPELSVRAMYGPETNSVVLRADILRFDRREEVAGGVIRVLDPGRKDKVLREEPLPAFYEWYSDATFALGEGVDAPVLDYNKIAYLERKNRDIEKENRKRAARGQDPKPLAPLPEPEPKELVVAVELRDADGEALGSAETQIEILRKRFPWMHNDIGITDEVIPPWTPVTVAEDRVGVWNRSLTLDGLGLARALKNGGVDQIRAMRCVAVVDGEETVFPATAPRLVRQVDAEADWAGASQAAGIRLEARTRVEFDGFVRNRMTIRPAGEAPVRVEKLYWEVELPAAEATHFCSTAGGWAAVHAETPAYWSSQATGSGALFGDFVPYVWLTNSDRAFLWAADSDEGWVTDDDRSHPTIEIRRDEETVRLRVHFIELPHELNAPRTVTYAYQPFPAKPLPDGWRTIVCANRAPLLPSRRNTYFWFDGNWAVLWPYYSSPYPWSMETSRELFERVPHDSIHRPAVGSIAHSIGRYRDYEDRWFKGYAVDWASTPGQLGNANVTQSRGPIDFRLYHYKRWVKEADFRALYVDENYLAEEENHLTGNAYIRPDGRRQPGYSYFGLREYFKRLKIMFHQQGVPTPNLWQHVSSGAAHYAWFGDVFFEGENVQPTNLQTDYLAVLPASRLRSIGSSVCAGGVMTMMCQANRHGTEFKEKHVHQFVGWVMAHDILPEQVRWYYPIAQEARLYRGGVSFHPYWKESTPARAATPECLVSLHRTGKRALVWVVNTGREDREAAVRVDWQALGLAPDRTIALNVETGAEIELSGRGFTVPVRKRDWAALHLVERQALTGSASLRAGFEEGVKADEALGAEVFLPTGRDPGPLARTAGAEGLGLAVDGGDGVELWAHQHVTNEAGRIRFAARLAGEGDAPSRGAILQIAPKGGRVVPYLSVVIDREGRLVLRTVKPGRGAGVADSAAAPAPAPGWHVFDLRWSAGEARLSVDGEAIGSLPVQGVNVCEGIGPALESSAVFRFGGRRSAIRAIDEVQCWRAAE